MWKGSTSVLFAKFNGLTRNVDLLRDPVSVRVNGQLGASVEQSPHHIVALGRVDDRVQ